MNGNKGLFRDSANGIIKRKDKGSMKVTLSQSKRQVEQHKLTMAERKHYPNCQVMKKSKPNHF